jgi:hypothetical protein
VTPFIRRAFLVAAGLAVAIAITEIGLRLLPHLPVNAMGMVMTRDPILDHALRPHSFGRMKSREYNVTYRINSFGLRDNEPEMDHRRKGAIVLLGDSFMEGYGVARGEIAADHLRQRGISVVNAGVKSYSPLLHYLWLRHRGLALQSDTILLFFDQSDPTNDEFYGRRLDRDDAGLPARIRPRRIALLEPPERLDAMLAPRSALYAYLVHLGLKHFPREKEDIGYAGAADALDALFPGRDAIPDAAYLPRWRHSFEYLGLIRDLCRERGIAFAIVIYPYGHQVSPDAWPHGRVAHHFPPGVSSDRPRRVVEDWAVAEGIPVFSLWDAFRNHPAPGTLFFPHDGHWTPAGHALVAEEIAGFLGRP